MAFALILSVVAVLFFASSFFPSLPVKWGFRTSKVAPMSIAGRRSLGALLLCNATFALTPHGVFGGIGLLGFVVFFLMTTVIAQRDYREYRTASD